MDRASDLSILGRVTPADIQPDPYPHVIIEEALPPALFDALARTYPSTEFVAREEAHLNNKACLRGAAEVLGNPEIDPLWQAFFTYHASPEFLGEVRRVWGTQIERLHPGLADNFGKPLSDFEPATRSIGRAASEDNRRSDLVLDTVFGINTPVRIETAVRGPHIDSPHKLFSSLLYFRIDEDDSTGGEYELYGLRHRIFPQRLQKKVPRRHVRLAKRVPYRSNTLIFWLNSALSIHAVSPRAVTAHARRYVAVTGECYGGAARQGYFARHPDWGSPLGNLRNWLNR